jgi:hypothetical protein
MPTMPREENGHRGNNTRQGEPSQIRSDRAQKEKPPADGIKSERLEA